MIFLQKLYYKMRQLHPLKISKINQLTDDAVELIFDIPENLMSEFKFTAGQYITICSSIDDKDIRRAYSLCSDPNSGEIAVGVKRVEGGRMSTFLTQELKEGDILDVMPPKGSFCLNNEKNIIGICAGSGITPILSMIKSTSSKFTLVYGNKTQSSSMFQEELNNMNITSHYTYSREKVEGCFNSRIDKNLLSKLSENELFLNADGYYICGPGEMIDNVNQFLKDSGTESNKIHFERFTSGVAPKKDNNKGIKSEEIISNVMVSVDGDDIQLSATQGGSAITLTDGSSENHTLTGETASATAVLGPGSTRGSGVAHTGWAIKTVGTGGRAGRVHYETLVAGNIQGDFGALRDAV